MDKNEQPDMTELMTQMMLTVDRETKRLLSRELRSMSDFKGIYSVYKNFTTPIVVEMWRAAAEYLEKDIES